MRDSALVGPAIDASLKICRSDEQKEEDQKYTVSVVHWMHRHTLVETSAAAKKGLGGDLLPFLTFSFRCSQERRE